MSGEHDGGGGTGSARRWRERRLRSFPRHERMVVALHLSEALHHTSGTSLGPVEEGRDEEPEHETHFAYRHRWLRLWGCRRVVSLPPGPPQLVAATVGYVAAGTLPLAVVLVAEHDGLDDAMERAAEEEEEEGREVAEVEAGRIGQGAGAGAGARGQDLPRAPSWEPLQPAEPSTPLGRRVSGWAQRGRRGEGQGGAGDGDNPVHTGASAAALRPAVDVPTPQLLERIVEGGQGFPGRLARPVVSSRGADRGCSRSTFCGSSRGVDSIGALERMLRRSGAYAAGS